VLFLSAKERSFVDFSALVVLDDMDTLTTKGIEGGTSFLLRTLGRARRVSKVICTQRDGAIHAISGSIEVPGLSMDGEFQEFVAAC
jgi:hypothetical protein